MGWGPDPIWSTAKVTSCADANTASTCVSLNLQISKETAEAYATAGQYVQVKPVGDDDVKPIFLAIASAPGSSPEEFEFLIKKTDENSWITSAPDQGEVFVSQVLGGGYATEENVDGLKYDFPTQNVFLFATGSGIAPIRSVIESGCLKLKESGRTGRLYYGCRNAEEMSYMDRFPAWEESGIEVVPVFSQPENPNEVRMGYIQTALEEDGISIARNSAALLCGQKGMTEAVKDTLIKAGVFEGRILFNF